MAGTGANVKRQEVLHSVPYKKNALQKEHLENAAVKTSKLFIKEIENYVDYSDDLDESRSFELQNLQENQQDSEDKGELTEISGKELREIEVQKKLEVKTISNQTRDCSFSIIREGNRKRYNENKCKDESLNESSHPKKSKSSDGKGRQCIEESQKDKGAWNTCIKVDLDEPIVDKLIADKKLQDEEKLFKMILAEKTASNASQALIRKAVVCIKQKSQYIRHVWLAYRSNMVEEKNQNLVFVVHTSEKIKIESKFSTYLRCEDEILDKSMLENDEIHQAERKHEYDSDEMAQIKAFVKANVKTWMKKHSNLTKVSASWVKSSGFGTKTARIENIHCITLYVQIKGLVPKGEELFHKSIREYPIDVREGVFTLCGKPGDLHEKVKMGCKIDSGYGTSQGTIGPFVRFQNHSETYFLTSAHVALNERQMKMLTKGGDESIYYGICGNNTFQPPESETVNNVNKRHQLGKVELVVYREGDEDEAGVELALIKINTDREPESGDFPDDILDSPRKSLWSSKHFQFSSGKILERKNLVPKSNVFKFGCISGLTEGRYVDDFTSVRTNKLQERGLGVDVTLYNQIQIESKHFSEPFAKRGDSGSLVFAFNKNETSAVGILEGQMKPYFMVTPIEDAVRVIGKHLSYHKGPPRISNDGMECESYGLLQVIQLPFMPRVDLGVSGNQTTLDELERKTSNIETNIILHSEHTFGTVKEELTAMKGQIAKSNAEMMQYLDNEFDAVKRMLADHSNNSIR